MEMKLSLVITIFHRRLIFLKPFSLSKDLEGLLSTWKNIMEQAKCTAFAADEGVEGVVPVILHRAMGQTLSVVQDYFNENLKKMVVNSPMTFHEVTNYLQDIVLDLCDRAELYNKKVLLFDEYNIEEGPWRLKNLNALQGFTSKYMDFVIDLSS